ncbi:MAG: lipopolysaccharide heptosyltransferase II [Gammaproteobacteria bacterium]|nr:lipopolysaccharide heptosyltransferase II [Gammaproteobacteria bacterium]
MTAETRFLVVGPSWVGDMVMAQSLYKLLARRHPGAVVDVVAPPWSLPILARMPEVRRGVELAVGHGELGLGRRFALGRRLRGQRYDRAIVLPRSLKSALVPWFAAVPVRTGFLGESRYGLINDVRPFDPAVLDQTVKRFVALGTERGEAPGDVEPPALRASAEAVAALRSKLGLGNAAETIALMPGAEYGPAKQWPIERFAAVAGTLAAAGLDVWVLGSAKERPLGETIAAAAPQVRNLCGATSLEDAVDLLSAARVAVTNDSGLMHVAAAVGTHVVAIYGSSSPAFTPPLTPRKTVLYLGIECSPCFQRTCPLQHLRCLRDISARSVADAVTAALDAPQRADGGTEA